MTTISDVKKVVSKPLIRKVAKPVNITGLTDNDNPVTTPILRKATRWN